MVDHGQLFKFNLMLYTPAVSDLLHETEHGNACLPCLVEAELSGTEAR